MVEAYGEWLARTTRRRSCSSTPSRVRSSPGAQREFCRAWPNQTEVTVAGRHFVQEDSADAIGKAVADFIRKLD